MHSSGANLLGPYSGSHNINPYNHNGSSELENHISYRYCSSNTFAHKNSEAAILYIIFMHSRSWECSWIYSQVSCCSLILLLSNTSWNMNLVTHLFAVPRSENAWNFVLCWGLMIWEYWKISCALAYYDKSISKANLRISINSLFQKLQNMNITTFLMQTISHQHPCFKHWKTSLFNHENIW
jgi:hypothetical protein